MKYFTCMAYMPNLVCIFVSSTHLAIMCEVCIVVGCVLAHMCKNVGLYTPCVTYMGNLAVIFV